MSREAIFFTYTVAFLVLLITACSDSSSGQPVTNASSIKIPGAIQSAEVNPQLMTATLMVSDVNDANNSQEYALTLSGGQAQRTIELQPGSYIFTIEFKYSYATPGDTMLAYATSSEFTIGAGSNTRVSFNETDYTYPDSDGDGASNLQEIDAGTDPFTAPDTTAPAVQQSVPTRDAVNIPLDSEISVTFSEDVLNVSNTNFTVTSGAGQVAGNIAYDNVTFKATFTPASLLSYSENYTISLSSTITDQAGNPLSFTPLTFSTLSAPDTTPPTVLLTVPLSNAIDVSQTSEISLTFSEDMQGIDTTNFTVVSENFGPLVGTVAYDNVNFRATFIPENPLRYFENYTVNLNSSVTDLSGNPIDFTPLTFRTLGQSAWAKLYRGARHDKIFDIITLEDDSYVVTGETRSVGANQYDAWIARIDVEGNVLWQKTIGTGTNGVQSILTSDGYIIMALRNGVSSWLVQLQPAGNIVWIKEIADTNITSITAAESGYFAVVGAQNGLAWAAKFTNGGVPQWSNNYNIYRFSKIKRNPDGSFIAIGTSDLTANDVSSFLIKLNASDGSILIQRMVSTAQRDILQDVMPVGSSGYVAVGKYQPTDFSSISGWIVNFDTNGNINWQKLVFDMEYRAVLTTADSGAIAVGGNSNDSDMFISKFDSTQAIQWKAQYGGYNFDVLTSIHPLRDDGFVTGGYVGSFQGGNLDAIFMKMVQTGNIRFFHAASDAIANNNPTTTVSDGTASSSASNITVTPVTNAIVTNPPSTVVNTDFVIENIRGTTGSVATP
ncbi:Ig-like domain-containing protein, partial [Kaarinaea lacus]